MAGDAITPISPVANGSETNRASRNPTISRDGRRIGFDSAALLVIGGVLDISQAYLRDRDAGTTVLAGVNTRSAAGNGEVFDPWLSADGGVIAFHSASDNLVNGDSNAADNRYARVQGPGLIERVNIADAIDPFPGTRLRGARYRKQRQLWRVLAGEARPTPAIRRTSFSCAQHHLETPGLVADYRVRQSNHPH